MKNAQSNLSRRRLDRQIARMGSWSFAKQFPDLVLAIAENQHMTTSLTEAFSRRWKTDARLVERVRVWRENGAPREDVEPLLKLHLIGLIDDILSLAAGYAHEFTTGEHLASFTGKCLEEIERRRQRLERVRSVLGTFSPRRSVRRIREARAESEE
jgi:hypothetical protein